MRCLRSSGRRPPTSRMNFVSARSNSEKFSAQEAVFGRSFCLVVPELIRSARVQLNERVLLQRPFELLTSSQSFGLARHSRTPPPGHAYRAIRGRRFARGRRPRSIVFGRKAR
jgi:hypothetical protein